jgi:RNA polymerase sporulation-specific sigma factor
MDEILYHINRVKSGDDASFEQLLSKYNALIISMAKKYSDMCATSPQLDDFLQEAKMAFYNSVLSYDEKTGVTFGAYAKVCVRNRLVSCVRVNNSKKRQKRSDTKDSYDIENPQDTLIVRELEKKLFSLAKDRLSPYEKKIFGYYLAGERAKEISKKVTRSEKSVNNAIYRIKAKLKRTANSVT